MGADRYIVCFNIPLFCNILTTILRPNFEEPLNTAKQMVENNITMFGYPGAYHPDIFNSSNDPYYKASHQNQKEILCCKKRRLRMFYIHSAIISNFLNE